MLKAKQFLSIYDGFLESGLTVRDYCVNQHMTESMFYYWQNKLKEQLPPKRGFVPVVFDKGKTIRTAQVPSPVQNRSKTFADPLATDNTISCEISYLNGVCLKTQRFDKPGDIAVTVAFNASVGCSASHLQCSIICILIQRICAGAFIPSAE